MFLVLVFRKSCFLCFQLHFMWVVVGCAEDFIIQLANSSIYNKHVPPKVADGGAVEVTIQLYVNTIGPLNDRDGTIELGYYFRQRWTDKRLSYDEKYGNLTTQTIPSRWIWTPDIVVNNAKKLEPVYETSRTVFHPNGFIYFSQRMKAIIQTKLDFKYYPFDEQTCQLFFESYAFTKEQVNAKWHETPITVEAGRWPFTPGYVIKGSETTRKVEEYYIPGLNSTSFVILVFSIHMKRTLMYYLIQTYIPSTLLIILNLASYWIPDGAVPARITLIITTFLSNVIILEKATAMTAQLDFMTPMQVFLLFNTCLIVISLLEYVLLLSLNAEKEVEKNFRSSKRDEGDIIFANKGVNFSNEMINGTKLYFVNRHRSISLPIKQNEIQYDSEKPKRKRAAHKLDQLSRKIFPGIFILFSLIYWVVFSVIT